VLEAGLPVLPLSPISKVGPDDVFSVLVSISERLVKEATPEQQATLWAATKILMGLRHPRETVENLTGGISAMILGIRGIEESTVYQGIFAEGEAKARSEGETLGELVGVRKAFLRMAVKRLGPPGEQISRELSSLNDIEQLNRLMDRLEDVSTWDELLETQSA
jgi:predicted transposase YdaD